MLETKTYSQKAIVEYLNGESFSIIDPDFPGYVTMNGNIVTNGVTFNVLVNIPPQCPPVYPTFHLVDTDFVFKEPHIERPHKMKNGSTQCRLCVRKEEEKTFNANPAELFHNLYNNFLGLLDGFSNGSFDSKIDLFAEFDSYWANDFSLFWHMQKEPTDKSYIKHAVLIENGLQINIMTDNLESVKQFAASTGQQLTVQLALYIDLGSEIDIPLPYTYADFFEVLKRSGHDEFIKKESNLKKESTIIIFSFNLPDGSKHRAGILLAKQPVIKKGKQLHENNRLKTFFNHLQKGQPMKGAHIKSIKQSHIFKRGGNYISEETCLVSKKIAIVGCGSIGSTLAYKLCKSGVTNLVLIDPGKLQSDNVGRHLLGMGDIKKYKAESVAKYLRSQFIDMKIEFINLKIEETLSTISNVDIIITAIGSDAPAVEPWLAEKVKAGELPQMISCWLEANAIAGHALMIDTEFVYYFEDIIEKISILDNDYASSLLLHEVGCNSTYMPYSYIDADIHINRMTKFVLNLVHGNKTRGITSIGEVEIHKEYLKREVTANNVESIDEKNFNA